MSKMLPSGIDIRIREDLAEGIARTQTTLIIDPIITRAGYRVTMTDIGDKGYGKIDQGTAREELISWTGITDNGTTYTLTGVVWGVNFHNLNNSVDNYLRHTSGAKFSINTDMHYITEQFVAKDDFDVLDNTIGWGDGTNTDKTLEARNGDINVPFIRYDASENKWLFSNDGVDTYDPSQGGSGLISGDGININAGAIDVDANELMGASDSGLTVVSNRVNVKNNTSKMMVRDTTGVYPDITSSPVIEQTYGKLVGGTTLNSIADFKALKYGSNDGKISVSIDGTTHNDLAIDLRDNDGTDIAVIDVNYPSVNTTAYSGQSFTITETILLSKISVKLASSGNQTITLRQGEDVNGTILGTAAGVYSGTSNYMTATFLTPIILTPGIYSFFWPNGTLNAWVSSGSVYSGGRAWNGTWQSGYDLTFKIIELNYTFKDQYSELATVIQEALRGATSKTETVTYNTNHFEITSSTFGRNSKVLKLTTPSSGTDLGVYLDLKTNATETFGDGDENRIARTDNDGFVVSTIKTPTEPGQVIALNSDNAIPLVNGLFPFKVLQTTRTIDAASGTVAISHGLGYTPRRAMIIALATQATSDISGGQNYVSLSSNGFSDGNNNNACSYISASSIGSNPYPVIISSGNSNNSAAFIKVGLEGDSFQNTFRTQSATITFDSTNINLIWTKTDAGQSPNSITGITINLTILIA